jgi:hypothetical protein
MNRSFFATALLLLFAAGSSLAATFSNSYTSSKLSSGQLTVANVCVLPAQGQLNRVGMKGKEGMSQESDAWGMQLQSVVENHLKEIGAKITSKGMSSSELESNDQLRQIVLQVQQKFDNVATQMNRKPKDIKKERYTLGDEVALLPCSADSDALAFVEGTGSVLTGGKKAFGMLVAGASHSDASLKVTFVDAKSGDVLAYTFLYNNNGKFEQDPEAAYGKRLGKEFQRIGIGPKPGQGTPGK